MAAEPGIKIDTGELLSSLECSVCCNEYTEPCLTKCGHTFCRPCIEECVNRNHECPECKRHLVKEDLMKNIQIDRLQRTIHQLHDASKNEIVDNILALEGGVMKSPIVAMFQANLKDSLLRFERLSDEAKREMEDCKKRIKAKYSNPLPGLDKGQQKKMEEQEIEAAEKKYKAAVDYYLRAYDSYMKEALPNPSSLPIKLNIEVPSKGVYIKEIYLKPSDFLREVRLAVDKFLLEQGNPILKWGVDTQYRFIDPVCGSRGEPLFLSEEMRYLSEFKLYPNTNIEVSGTIICESDVPKPCITLNFRKEENKAFNYYSCEECGINWICEPCSQQCHKGHTLKEYLKNHIPTWACCYCTKKNCQLPNKNNPIGKGH